MSKKQRKSLKKIYSILPLALLFTLTSCSTEKEVDYSKNIFSSCKLQTQARDKSMCVEDTLADYGDDWVRSCVENNIDAKKTLADQLSKSQITDAGIEDIGAVLNECAFYRKENKEKVTSNSSSSPIFDSFIGSAIGSFAGNYLAYSLLSSTQRTSWDNGTYTGSRTTGTSGAGYIGRNGTTNSTNGDKMTGTNGGKTSTLGQIDSQHKADNWNIKEMKANSALKSNYKIGNTGKSWSSLQNLSTVKSSYNSTTTSRSSWGGSSSSSSLG